MILLYIIGLIVSLWALYQAIFVPTKPVEYDDDEIYYDD